MVISKIKTIIFTKTFSNCLFFTAIIINSLVYLLYDFISNDVEPSIRIYGRIQLIITLVTAGIMLISAQNSNNLFKRFSLYVLYLPMGVLLFIQVVPAILWILFNSQVVAETHFDNGIMGSWLYGMYHILIIVWGIFNIHQYKQSIEKRINRICKN